MTAKAGTRSCESMSLHCLILKAQARRGGFNCTLKTEQRKHECKSKATEGTSRELGVNKKQLFTNVEL